MSENVLWTALCRAVQNYVRVYRIKVARLQKDAMSLADQMAMFKHGLNLESAKAVSWDSVARGPFQDLEHSSNMQLHWISRKGPSNQDLKGNCPIRISHGHVARHSSDYVTEGIYGLECHVSLIREQTIITRPEIQSLQQL